MLTRPRTAELAWRLIRPTSDIAGGATEQDIKQARSWLNQFNAETLPKNMFDFSFSRSSGPGGQNVNKCVAYLLFLDIRRLTNSGSIPRLH